MPSNRQVYNVVPSCYFTFVYDQMFGLKLCIVCCLRHDLNSPMEACETVAAILPCNPVLFLQVGKFSPSPSMVKTNNVEKDVIRAHLLVQPIVSFTIISDPISRIWTNSEVLSMAITMWNNRWWDKEAWNTLRRDTCN